jgi:hypothetical protein
MNRLYVALGLLVTVGLAWWRYDYVTTQWQAEKARADQAIEDYTTAKAKLDTERQNAADAELRAQKRIADKEAIENELRKKTKCIDAGTCGYRLRWREAICAGNTVHSADSGPSGFDEIQTTERGDFERWVADLTASVKRDAKVIEGLQTELEVKSRVDACVVKQVVK